MQQIECVETLAPLPPRRAESHKGDFGRILVVAGSRGMSGAAVLCGSAALRGGAGLVRIAVPAEILPIVAVGNPCYLTAALPQDEKGRLSHAAEPELLALIQANDVVAAGPGLGLSEGTPRLVRAMLQSDKPLVLDADGLNALQGETGPLHDRKAPLILTPHPGEFARLIRSDTTTVQAKREELAVGFAAEHALVLVLKGHGTLVTDGRRLYRNKSGNPSMAKGGSGDVLTGLIAALLGQGLEAFQAACLGVCLHGMAGDLARDVLGEVAPMATDLLDYLPRAFQRQKC